MLKLGSEDKDTTALTQLHSIFEHPFHSGEFPAEGLPNTMALIVSIELNNATFEDLATLVSTAGAAGADESTTIEIDEEQQVLRVIIEDPISPDIDTSDPTFFTFFDNDTDDDEDEDFGEDFDDSRNFEGFEPDYGRHSGGPKPFDLSTAINDFIDNLKDELPFGPPRRNNPGRYESDWKNPNKFPPADFLYGLAEDYFRDFGYRGKNRGDSPGDSRGNFRGEDRGGQHRDDPIQDDFYTDEPRFEDFAGKKNPFGSAGGGDFSELRNAGEGFFKGLSDFINEQVDRRTENSKSRGGRRGRGPVNGYGSFTNPGAYDDHPEGTSRDDQDTEEKLKDFRDFPGQDFSSEDFSGLSYLNEDDIDGLDAAGENEGQSRRGNDGEYSPGDGNRRDEDKRDEGTDDENES